MHIRIAAGAMLALVTSLASVAFAETVLAPNHTHLYAVMDERISSKMNHDGDAFTMHLKDGFFHHNPPSLVGATVDAHIENDTAAGPMHKATMTIVLDDLKLPNGTSVALPAKLVSLKTFEPHTHHIRDAGFIIGGAVMGHMMNGHHHGGMAGAAAGFALASALKSDIIVKKGTQVDLKLNSDIVGN